MSINDSYLILKQQLEDFQSTKKNGKTVVSDEYDFSIYYNKTKD